VNLDKRNRIIKKVKDEIEEETNLLRITVQKMEVDQKTAAEAAAAILAAKQAKEQKENAEKITATAINKVTLEHEREVQAILDQMRKAR
jgi:hypothetical protein